MLYIIIDWKTKKKYYQSGGRSINISTPMFYLVEFILDFFNIINFFLLFAKEKRI
jgi:hypothetical protein